MSLFERILSVAKSGKILPGPEYVVKGLGQSRGGERALIYLIPNKNHPEKPSEKRVVESDFERAYRQLGSAGEFSRKWFNSNFGAGAKVAPCNFRAIGAVFVLLGIARYIRGKYISSSIRDCLRDIVS